VEAPLLPRRRRLTVSLIVGVAAAILGDFIMGRSSINPDTHYWLAAAVAVLRGVDPYAAIGPGRAISFEGGCVYPLPAALDGIPFALFGPRAGTALFVGSGYTLACYGLLSLASWRVLALASVPGLGALTNGQWAPMLLGAAILPSWGWLLAVKPTIGAALFLYRPRLLTLVAGASVCVAPLFIYPTWPFDWLRAIEANSTSAQYVAPITLPGGFLLLLALLRWRRPEARLLTALAFLPQNFLFYDQLPLLLVPESRRSMLALVVATHVAGLAARATLTPAVDVSVLTLSAAWAPFVLWGIYAPCVTMLLLRANAGYAPAWLERRLVQLRLPGWVRGQTTRAA
jgi:hypothetical protein